MTADNIMFQLKASEKLTQLTFDELCKQAYLSGGLKAFVRAAELYDSATPIGFNTFMHYATKYYGVSQVQIADEIGICKASMSKWCSGKSVPIAPSRKLTHQVVMRHLTEQLKALS